MKTDPNLKMTRREAIKVLGLSAATVSLGGYTASAQGFSKNETLNIGLIGCGGRMRGRLVPAMKKIPGLEIVAVCDAFDDFCTPPTYPSGAGIAIFSKQAIIENC